MCYRDTANRGKGFLRSIVQCFKDIPDFQEVLQLSADRYWQRCKQLLRHLANGSQIEVHGSPQLENYPTSLAVCFEALDLARIYPQALGFNARPNNVDAFEL